MTELMFGLILVALSIVIVNGFSICGYLLEIIELLKKNNRL